MNDIYLSLGSNMGDRETNLREAVARLSAALHSGPLRVSSIIETPSQGFAGADFLNCAVLFRSSMDPLELLHVCKDIEREMGRTGAPEYASDGSRIYHDRIIDIDIILYGDLTVDTPELTIPHPRMHGRDFVMTPLLEILDSKIS